MSGYAAGTEVPIERSRAEIERILMRYGAQAFMYATQPEKAMIAFRLSGRQICMVLPMPTSRDKLIKFDGRGRERTDAQLQLAIEKEARRRWRALSLIIKAKLEAVSSGIAVLEDEFLAYVQLPSGDTVGTWMRPQIAAAYENGKMPALLPGGRE